MAGSASEDNPVGINVTAMVDIIFCLCLFFLCSMHFKQLEGKIQMWLPGPGGPGQLTDKPILEEVRVIMKWDGRRTVSSVGNREPARDDADLMATIKAMAQQHIRTGHPEFPIVIDAVPAVPWTDVVHVTDLCKGAGYQKLSFTAPMR